MVFTESLCWRSCISFSFSDNFASIFLLVKGHKSLFLTSLGYHMRYTGILHVYYKAHLSHDVLRRLHNAYIDSFSSRLTYENNKNIGNNCHNKCSRCSSVFNCSVSAATSTRRSELKPRARLPALLPLLLGSGSDRPNLWGYRWALKYSNPM